MSVPTLRVFVSSTWLDLEPERRAVEHAVHRLRQTKFVGMEYFGSRDDTTRRASLHEVDRSHVYVGIIATRYGSGITADEYRRAREHNLPCFIYVKDEPPALPPDLQEDAATAAQLNDLKDELQRSHTVNTFTSPDNLAAKITADLHNWLFDIYLTPRLEASLRGEVSRTTAQALLDGLKSVRDLGEDLLKRLRGAGFNVAAGERSAAISGDDNLTVTGDENVVVERAGGDVVRGDKIVYATAPPTVSARHQLRAPVGDFVGREQETATLTAALRTGGAAGISGISGMGGIGKTELSLYVADRLREHYPDAQLFVDMRGTDEHPRDPREALADCIRAFAGLEQRLPESLEDLVKLYRAALDGKRALILLDNAHDATQVRPLLPPAGSALLVTSRETIPLPGMKRLTLEQLPPDKARELLTGIAPRIPSDIADQICYLCGYLPLALRAAASLLDITLDLDPAHYAQQLSDERTRLQHIGTEGVDLDVEASITLSYNRLTPDAARVFRLLSVFPATFDAPAEEVICEDPSHKHLTNLLRRNLVIFDADSARYRLHDLTRLFADARLSEKERSAGQMRHARHYLGVLGSADKLYLQGSEAIKRALALFDLEWRNIQAGQLWVEKQSGENDAAAVLCKDYPTAGEFLLNLRQHPREQIRWLSAGMAAARQLKDRNAEEAHLYSLGSSYTVLGETRRAIECLEQALAMAREAGNRYGEGMVLGSLGIVHTDLGKMHLAIEFHEQALTIAREVGNRRGEGINLGNLGRAYAELGETRRSIEFYEQRLAIAREFEDAHGEGIALGNLGVAHLRLGELQRALELNEQSLAIAREIRDRSLEALTLFNTAEVLYRLGDYDQCITHAEAGLEILRQIESPHVGRVRAQIAQWRGQG